MWLVDGMKVWNWENIIFSLLHEIWLAEIHFEGLIILLLRPRQI